MLSKLTTYLLCKLRESKQIYLVIQKGKTSRTGLLVGVQRVFLDWKKWVTIHPDP